jgi:hypothetical protein
MTTLERVQQLADEHDYFIGVTENDYCISAYIVKHYSNVRKRLYHNKMNMRSFNQIEQCYKDGIEIVEKIIAGDTELDARLFKDWRAEL